MMTHEAPSHGLDLPHGLDNLATLGESGTVSFIWAEADSWQKLSDYFGARHRVVRMVDQICVPGHVVTLSYFTPKLDAAQVEVAPVPGSDELVEAREWLLRVESGFGVWFNESVVLMVREGTYFGDARPGHTLPRNVYPCSGVDEALRRAGVDPDALGEGY